ncbi:hypothetical protein ACFWMH_27475 [Streptomyces tendae]|uniref:hypothetical protein n=1 Tax=Streptomyces tendae TaxID=1932 RepID=UPI003664D2A1
MNQPPAYPPPPPSARPRWGRFTAWTVGAALAAFAVGGGLAVLLDNDEGESIVSETACRDGLQENMTKAMADGPDGESLPPPAACYSLDQATLERIAGEVMTEYLDSPEAEKLFEDAIREAMESAAASTGP